MCGIVGYIGMQAASDILLAGLQKLEYRGYDSAGIATVSGDRIHCVRAKGKLENLRQKLHGQDDPATIGIGHTRWATHGKPEERNAHPHLDRELHVAVVQNGIVENYRELREELIAKGYEFLSDTDTETIPHLVADCLKNLKLKSLQDGGSAAIAREPSLFFAAVRQAVSRLEGAFAIAAICADFPNEMIVVRQQAPLVIGFGQGELFCASDTPAIVPHTRAVLNLENGEIGRLTALGVEIYTFGGKRLTKTPRLLDWNPVAVEKHGFRHFMLKEIHEQPGVVRDCLAAYFDSHWTPETRISPVTLGLEDALFDGVESVQILACGTSWHASLVGKYLLEQLAGIPTLVQYASEFRYSPAPMIPNTLTIGVTQSGETADTLAALEMERDRRGKATGADRARLLGITNRPESSLGQLVPNVIDTHAGIEIGVAATKTFVAQVMAFYALAIDLSVRRGKLGADRAMALIGGLRTIPNAIESILSSQESHIEELAHDFSETRDFIFLGRGINFPIALEGALKLKEISYIHAEGYPAGEMKHGPIALIDAHVPVVAIAMPGMVYDKVLSNAQEAKARDARLIGVVPDDDPNASEIFDDVLAVPAIEEVLSPIVASIPLQLLSYYIAARRGLDVDQPRNLAKSVTVE